MAHGYRPDADGLPFLVAAQILEDRNLTLLQVGQAETDKNRVMHQNLLSL